MNSESASNFGIGLLVGVAIGVMTGMLFAPRPGKEIRSVIGERVGEVVGKAGEVVGKAGEVVGKAGEVVGKAKERVVHATGRGDDHEAALEE